MSVFGQAVFITLIKVEIEIQTHSYIFIFVVAVVQEQKSDAVSLSGSPNLLLQNSCSTLSSLLLNLFSCTVRRVKKNPHLSLWTIYTVLLLKVKQPLFRRYNIPAVQSAE